MHRKQASMQPAALFLRCLSGLSERQRGHIAWRIVVPASSNTCLIDSSSYVYDLFVTPSGGSVVDAILNGVEWCNSCQAQKILLSWECTHGKMLAPEPLSRRQRHGDLHSKSNVGEGAHAGYQDSLARGLTNKTRTHHLPFVRSALRHSSA